MVPRPGASADDDGSDLVIHNAAALSVQAVLELSLAIP